ncbi:hypothetical protein, partial [Escherichia coli]|uniref:hypothetical protein n=1 Tax=Escherichia coli TaxID=562 RepID=UPI000BB83558
LKSRNLSVPPFKNSVNTLTYWYTEVLKSRNLSVPPFKNSVNTLTYWYTEVASDKNALNLE